MKVLQILWLLALPLLVLAQSSSPSPSQTVVLSTTLSTFDTFGPDRQLSTGTRTIVITSTVPLQTPSGSTISGTNATLTTNSTASSTSPTTTRKLPTAPTTIDGGGGTNGAPLPGATGAGGAYGPNDNYIAAAVSLQRSSVFVGIGGLLVSGALMVL